jgi:hypothetical protein
LSGIPSFISDKIQYDDPKTLEKTIRRAKWLYDQHKGKPTFQRSLKDKKKFKMEHRKKGNKPPFFRNNSEGQKTPRYPRVTEAGGQRTRLTPIQCWGCKGDHMYRDFPHISDKVRSFYNVQEYETMEDMGRTVPMIYASLDNKK